MELIIKDSQGSAEKAVSFAKQLIEEEDVLAIIGPSTSGESMKLKGLCDDAEMILLSCAAAETIVNPVAQLGVQGGPDGQLRGADDLLHDEVDGHLAHRGRCAATPASARAARRSS